jgi:hypothetical protein
MSDVTIRALVITAVVTIALLVAWAVERRRSVAPTKLTETGLRPGVYLFTSDTCQDCVPARQRLVAALGEAGFTEYAWDGSPEVFERLEITHVPASMIVAENGSARCWFGQPDRMLAAVGP